MIEKVIHMYLGCEVDTPLGYGVFYKYNREVQYVSVAFGIMGPDFERDSSIEDVKLILKPLTEEYLMAKSDQYEERNHLHGAPQSLIDTVVHMSTIMAEMINEGYDVFELIKQGHAIPKQ